MGRETVFGGFAFKKQGERKKQENYEKHQKEFMINITCLHR